MSRSGGNTVVISSDARAPVGGLNAARANAAMRAGGALAPLSSLTTGANAFKFYRRPNVASMESTIQCVRLATAVQSAVPAELHWGFPRNSFIFKLMSGTREPAAKPN